jgi:receptor protein-tyrosine kinase
MPSSDLDRVGRGAKEKRLEFAEAAAQLQLLSQDEIDSATARQFTYPVLQREGHGIAADVIAAYAPQSAAVEPLRALRSQLTLRWLQTSQRKALAIASHDRGDGRSWLAANLATVFAQGGERTLLIDADMRYPSQHRLFNLDNSAGLSALLMGHATVNESVRRIHPGLRLFVLPAGPPPPNPQELLVCPEFASLLSGLAQLFDVTVLDTPAAGDTADAHIVAARAGGAVLLARRNHTRMIDLAATLTGLKETGANVVGNVVSEY